MASRPFLIACSISWVTRAHIANRMLRTRDAADCARWGCATAALCITKRGAIPAMPSLDDVTALLAQ